MFIKNGLRFNIHQRYTDPETGEKGIDMSRPENRERFGVTEIPDPTPPEDYSDETYYRTEQQDAPYVIFTKKSAEQLEMLADGKALAQARQHLADTDYLFTVDRNAKLLADEPTRATELQTSREVAREVIRAYKVKYPVTL